MRSFTLFLFLAASVSSHGAINILGYDAAFNDRYTNDSAFVASQFDLSGITRNATGAGSSGWITMISPNVYLTAEHAQPMEGSNATFYKSNDPNGTSSTRSVTGNRQQIGTTDLFVGTLDAPLTGDFTFYDFATETISNNNTATDGPPQNQVNAESFINSPYAGVNAYLFGRSPTGSPSNRDMAVGRNILDRFQADVTVTGANQGDFIGGNIGGANEVPFEAQLVVGDSGGPLMVENGSGKLTIVGINWFASNETDPNFFGTSYVGNYSEQIQNFIDANPVPEPSNIALLFGFFVFILEVSRRRVSRKSGNA